MTLRFVTLILILTLLFGCKTRSITPTNNQTYKEQFNRTLAPALDNRILELIGGLALFKKERNHWPKTKTEFSNFQLSDTLGNSSKDFRALYFSNNSDTLTANFKLVYDSITNITGTLKMKDLNDSTYVNLVSNSEDSSMVKVNFDGIMKLISTN